MDPHEYELMDAVEARMWWYRAAHRNLVRLIRDGLGDPAATILDAGCGTGGLIVRLRVECPQARVLGLDIAPRAVALTRRKTGVPVVLGSADRLPFRDRSLSAVLCIDVLEHGWADPDALAAQAFRCLAESGRFVVQVPAYEWLRGCHDERVNVARRYTRSRLRRLLVAAGFRVEYCSHWNTFLFPLMVLRRLVFRPTDGSSDVLLYPPLVEALFRGITWLESQTLALGLRLPFGGSIIAVGVKDG